MIHCEYRPGRTSGTHLIRIQADGSVLFYPSMFTDTKVTAFYPTNAPEDAGYGEPPSVELRSLIEAGAPWYAVMDKLSEEYPQWQHHFDEAIRRHQAEQPAGEPQPQEGRA